MFKKKTVIIVSLMLVLALVAVGCSSNEASVTPADPNKLVVAQASDAVSLDPHAENDNASARVMKQMYETLVEQDETMEIASGLAVSWEQVDERTYEFQLKEGVKFHNGEEMTADDVVFTFKRAAVSPRVAAIVGVLDADAIEAVDTYTVRVATKEPFAPILAHLAHPAASILNEKAVTEAGADYGQKPVGTGPYMLENWQKDEFVELIKFEDYHDETRMANIETVVFRAISEAGNRTIELETGGIDIAYDIPAMDVNRVEEHANLNLIRDMNFSTTYIGFNAEKEPFNDVRVRQAINYALNMDAIVGAAYDGIGTPAKGPLGANVWGANLDLEAYGHNVEKAKELMKEAGYEDGFSTEIWTNQNPQRIAVMETVQNQLREIGITVETRVLDWGVFLQDTEDGKHDMIVLGWGTVTGDPDYGLYVLFHSDAHGAAGNRTFYTNPRVDELLDLGRVTADPEERAAIYHEAQEIIREDAPWVFTWNGEEITGVKSYVKGFKNHPAGHHTLWNVSYE
ncbi:peptide/nickel transport system substrate-binding protein [Natronincola peptidivorans]|uniref:Peptide/nickel transport system substrate-binding protein n=1 Tax=Natronincola peptidivorans TaxID=426128 RepID=A0A1I0ANF5_9FIRM|nr:glutathione ABC transporter substrate-binding protein [Natronincola peptidivorans]SES95927.1 peptide/nickel transport system substrate-binding protein [Natronincola peptidivorans]